jgi:hypothetical protein
MIRPPFPAAIDNTMRAAFRACPRKMMLAYLHGYTNPSPRIHLIAGGAFARGMEVTRKAYYDQGLSEDESIALGYVALHEEFVKEGYTEDDEFLYKNKAPNRMGGALINYFQEYPLDRDEIRPAKMANGKHAIEFNFGIPLPIAHPETGLPIIYCGRFDMLGQKDNMLFVVDEKTTGSLGEYWFKRYELSAQFTGYCWAARQHDFPVVGALIRGIGILKGQIKHATVPLMRPDWMIDEWYAQLINDIRDMIEYWKADNWPADYADSCGSYGGCQFTPVCGISPQGRDSMLGIQYVIRSWEPLRGDIDGD